MGVAEYKVISRGSGWSVLHDGAAANDYASKEAAFESAVAAASLAIREGHEVHVSVPGREAGGRTALGVRDQSRSWRGATPPSRPLILTMRYRAIFAEAFPFGFWECNELRRSGTLAE